MAPEKATVGEKVKTSGWTRRGSVVKVKPDGTRVIKTKVGTLKKDKDPEKPVPSEAERQKAESPPEH